MERDPRVDKHDALLDKLVEQQVRLEEILKAQVRRNDIADEALKKKSENDVTKELELAKQLAMIGQSMTMIKWAATLIGGTLIIDILQRILPK